MCVGWEVGVGGGEVGNGGHSVCLENMVCIFEIYVSF